MPFNNTANGNSSGSALGANRRVAKWAPTSNTSTAAKNGPMLAGTDAALPMLTST